MLSEHPAEARAAIEGAVRAQLERGHTTLVLGGDHSITYPVVRAFREHMAPAAVDPSASVHAANGPTIVHLDAHADLYREFDGDRYSHACPFTRIMEERLASRLIQIGIRTLTAEQRGVAAEFGVEIFGADRWRDALPIVASLRGPVYVSLDLDVLEPMLAPGLSHPEPGGLSVREVLYVLAAIQTTVVGADIVEYNPRNDVRHLTARVAAKFLKELVGAATRCAG